MRIVEASCLSRKILSVIVLVLGTVQVGATQLALVDQDFGHALLFDFRGNCVALLPSHVARGDRFTLEMPLQRLMGSGTVILRDKQSDLAIAHVDGDIRQRCSEDWSKLQVSLDDVLENKSRAEIVRLGPEGFQDRTSGIVVEFNPDTILVSTTNELAPGDIQQGTSGSALEIDGNLVGIAQQSNDIRTAWFFRTDRIARLAAPYLGTASNSQVTIPPVREDGSKGFVVTAWSGTGGDEANAAALDRGVLGRAYIAPWTGKPLSIELTLDPDRPVQVDTLQIGSGPTMPSNHTPPRTILLEADVGSPDAPYWRSLGARDMPPSGLLDFTTGSAFARRLRITVQSTWIPGRDLRIDSLSVK